MPGECRMSVPVVGEVLDLKVHALGERGDGIAFHDGFVVIVKSHSLLVGDLVKVKVTRVLNKYAFGEEAGDDDEGV